MIWMEGIPSFGIIHLIYCHAGGHIYMAVEKFEFPFKSRTMCLISLKDHYIWFIFTSILFYFEEVMTVRGSERGCDR